MPSNIREFLALMSTQLNTDVLDIIQEHFFAQFIQRKWRNSHYLTKKCHMALSYWFFWEFGSPFAQQPFSLIFDKTSGIIRNHNRNLSLDDDFEIFRSSYYEGSVSQRHNDFQSTDLASKNGVHFFSYGSPSKDSILWSSKDTSSDLAGKMSQNKPLYGYFLVVIENGICRFLHLPEEPNEYKFEYIDNDGEWYFDVYFLSYSEIWRINSKGQVVSKCPFPSESEAL